MTTIDYQKICVCGGASKTVKFGIKPTELGHIGITVKARSYQTSSAASICGPNHVSLYFL